MLDNPEGIVAKAATLLTDTRLPALACGLAVATGRRFSELLSGQSRYEAASAWSVFFTGQRKHRGDPENFRFEIPTLVSADHVLLAWERLLKLIGNEVLTPHSINNRYNHIVNQAAEHHFRGLVPSRLPAAAPGDEGSERDPHARERKADAIYLHLFRAVYATIAVHWFCPPRVNRITYKAEIQGHRQILEADGSMRRSYAASRHYDDYQIGDGKGNIDGRQGIKLGTVPGLEILTVFRKPGRGEDILLTDSPDEEIPLDVPVTIVVPSPSAVPPEPETSMPPKTPAQPSEAAPAPYGETPTAAPTSATEKAPAKTSAKRASLYRIHSDDKARLEEDRAKLNEGRTKADEVNQPDHLHPNAPGIKVIVDRIGPAVKRLFFDPNSPPAQ